MEDIAVEFEEAVLREPYSLSLWISYISTFPSKWILYDRALYYLPRSYKLWKRYLDACVGSLRGKDGVEYASEYAQVNAKFERALRTMSAYPRIWLDYVGFLRLQPCITRTRRTLDRALRALPLLQHGRIWKVYVDFAVDVGGETAYRVVSRYVQFKPDYIEDYIELLMGQERYVEAATRLVQVVQDPEFQSAHGRSHFQLFQVLMEIFTEHPDALPETFPVEEVVMEGMETYPEQAGVLWCALGQHHARAGRFEEAREVYERGLGQVTRVRDVVHIFDAYAEFEETLVSARMDMIQDGEEEDEVEVEEDMARLEALIERRPWLISDVKVRANPNDVKEWLVRIGLCQTREKKVEVYEDACRKVDPGRAVGEAFSEVWCRYAEFWDQEGDVEKAREVWERAIEVEFRTVAELATVWCRYAEMEIKGKRLDKAIELMSRATVPPSNQAHVDYYDERMPPQKRIFKSLRVWSLYADLEESVGTVESTRAVYDKIIQLGIANPQTIINYATFLEEKAFFEESFRVYERGIDLFGYPVAFELWNVYLPKFVQRYGGTKMERARDLFEQALVKCPAKYAKAIYLAYGKLEEEHGLARHAMRIYDRATEAVSASDRLEMFRFYIAKAAQVYGILSTREIYQRALDALDDADAKEMALEFAEMERKLGEIDRARVILAYGSQFADPRTDDTYWSTWHGFEVAHGNEDTFKEMLRVKRSVQAKFNTDSAHVAAQLIAAGKGEKGLGAMVKGGVVEGRNVENPMAAVEAAHADEIAIDAMEE